jgi:hypothetical protein
LFSLNLFKRIFTAGRHSKQLIHNLNIGFYFATIFFNIPTIISNSNLIDSQFFNASIFCQYKQLYKLLAKNILLTSSDFCFVLFFYIRQDNISKSRHLMLGNSRQSSPLMLFTGALYQNLFFRIQRQK